LYFFGWGQFYPLAFIHMFILRFIPSVLILQIHVRSTLGEQ
jgi:hypothetical protein